MGMHGHTGIMDNADYKGWVGGGVVWVEKLRMGTMFSIQAISTLKLQTSPLPTTYANKKPILVPCKCVKIKKRNKKDYRI